MRYGFGSLILWLALAAFAKEPAVFNFDTSAQEERQRTSSSAAGWPPTRTLMSPHPHHE
jgi:hypothetical protein